MTQALSLIALLGLLSSFVQPSPARPGEEYNGASLNGAGYVGQQSPSLNGAPSQVFGPSVRYAVEGVELPNGMLLGR